MRFSGCAKKKLLEAGWIPGSQQFDRATVAHANQVGMHATTLAFLQEFGGLTFHNLPEAELALSAVLGGIDTDLGFVNLSSSDILSSGFSESLISERWESAQLEPISGPVDLIGSDAECCRDWYMNEFGSVYAWERVVYQPTIQILIGESPEEAIENICCHPKKCRVLSKVMYLPMRFFINGQLTSAELVDCRMGMTGFSKPCFLEFPESFIQTVRHWPNSPLSKHDSGDVFDSIRRDFWLDVEGALATYLTIAQQCSQKFSLVRSLFPFLFRRQTNPRTQFLWSSVDAVEMEPGHIIRITGSCIPLYT